MTQSISRAGKRGTRPATSQTHATDEADPFADIIADFRTSMTMLKCASSERVIRLGLSMAQLHILYTLQRNGEMTMSRLADVLNVSLSNATGLIDRIEERGFVERTRVPEDRRMVLIRVTPSGEQMLEEIDALSDELLRSVLSRIDRTKLIGVRQTAAALRDALAETTGGPPVDRHTASIATPRSPSTLRGVESTTHPHPARKD